MDWDSWELRDADPLGWPVPSAVVAIELLWRVARVALRLLYRRMHVVARRWLPAADRSAHGQATPLTHPSDE